ncbi:retrotransposon protein, putative, Ty1-copia sub-class [Cucumis melo var. makuwa]|uniref:Retrotransposon protein, putative, Ty1-copia sub-class n=1 Tax=Cucumis melo var. makuwa TaxID=1194695 RepID=A0A5A7U146_CUCMM|nr:retrotransposon protein, putative, Ty1-copia sub-class [Cucumis melo var. makuwa]
MECTRCLLTNASLPLKFWDEAAQIACYLINRSPSTTLSLKTSQEVWTGKAPSLNRLKVFGCTTYSDVIDGKLNKRALKCMFIGYPQSVKGDHVVTNVRIASEVLPSVGLDVSSDQSPLVSEAKDTKHFEFNGIQSQQERILIYEGAFIEESSIAYALTCATDSIEAEPLTFEEAIWIYKIKPGTRGDSKPKYKARLEAKGYTQKDEVDFHEIFSPVMNVTITFLHGELEEVIYMAQPKGYGVKGKEDMDSTETHMMLVFTGNYLRKEFIPIIHCDSQSVIHLVKNPSHHERSEHIHVKFYYIRNVITQKDVELVKVHTVQRVEGEQPTVNNQMREREWSQRSAVDLSVWRLVAGEGRSILCAVGSGFSGR